MHPIGASLLDFFFTISSQSTLKFWQQQDSLETPLFKAMLTSAGGSYTGNPSRPLNFASMWLKCGLETGISALHRIGT